MTPPQVASRDAPTRVIPFDPLPDHMVTGALGRVLDARGWPTLRAVVDVAVLYVASSLAVFVAPSVRSIAGSQWLAAIFPLLVFAIMHLRSSPDDRLDGSMLETIAHVFGVVSLSAMFVVTLELIGGTAQPLTLAFRLWLFSVIYLGAARAVLLWTRRQALRSDLFASPTLVVGAGVVGEHLVNRLAHEPRYGLRPVGFLDSDPLWTSDGFASREVPILGGPDDVARAIEATDARHVIIAFSSEPDRVLVGIVGQCQDLDVQVSLVPRLYESINDRATLDHVGGLPLVSLRPTNPRGWQFAVKHSADRVIAFVGLCVLAPVMIAIAIAIRVTSPGPVLFRQRRVGRDGRVFNLLKFRTMTMAEREHEFSPPAGCAPGGVEGPDRRTRVGRILRDLCLDELPQLVNVLHGEMSLVGPRPERPEFVERFSAEVDHYDHRHRVKSGITGWAQVHGLRGQTLIADRTEWDNYYIQNWSLQLDLRIFALTVVEVLGLRDGGDLSER